MRVYQVGGSVRDGLLGVPSNDIDYAVECSTFDELLEYISALGHHIVHIKRNFLTVKARDSSSKQVYDFVMCRRDGTYDAHGTLSQVSPGTILDDLSRRDFTINAIALDPEGRYVDPSGGRDDLQRGVVRLVGGVERIEEDALRVLRALRFSCMRTADNARFRLDGVLKDYLRSPRCLVVLKSSKLSVDRIKQEVNKLLRHGVDAVAVLNEHPLLADWLFNGLQLTLRV